MTKLFLVGGECKILDEEKLSFNEIIMTLNSSPVIMPLILFTLFFFLHA